jgi:PAS domain S-box-containing protein
MNIATSYLSSNSKIIPETPFDLQSWRNWLAKAMVIIAAIGLPLAMIPTLPTLIAEKYYVIIALDGIFWLYLISQVFIKGRSYRANAILFVSVIYALMISYFIVLGPVHARPGWLVFSTVVAALLFGTRASVISVGVNAVLLMLLYGFIGPENQSWAAEYAAPFSRWTMFVFNISVLSFSASAPVGLMLNRLDRSLKDTREAHFELSAERDKLQTAYSSLKDEIARRKKLEKALIKSEEKYRLLAENATDVIWTTDLNLNMTYVSPSIERVRGYSVDELMSLKVEEQLTPDSLAVATQVLTEELDKEHRIDKDIHRSRTLELESICKDGTTRWSETILSFIRDSDDKAIGILGVGRDITDRLRSEEELAKTESLLLASIEQTPAGIIIADAPDVTIRTANSAAMEILGEASGTLMDNPVASHPHCYQAYRLDGTLFNADELPLSQAVLHGKVSRNVDIIARRQDDDERWVSANAAPIYNNKGEIVAGVVVFSDITGLKQAEKEKRKLEDQLMRAQKMEAIGTLAGGIAHDFNNILAAIIGYSELSQMSVSTDNPAMGYIDKILKAGNRAKDLTQQILTFSRQTKQELKPVSVSVIVKEALRLLRASLPSSISIQQDIKSSSLVMGDATQIHQILMNLCTNAGHAMRKKGGILRVDLKKEILDADFVSRYTDLEPGNYLNLTVADDGHGMPPDVLDRIFDPFFTTKERGEGTGMGLAVVHGIVKSYGGTIYADSEPGNGTVFDVFLPVVESKDEPDKQEDEILPRGTERVLFVDDEPALVEIGEQMLERLGYQVVTRTSSLEALDLFRARPERFDLVITDMTMPQMSGDNLTAELISERNDIPIILCTGFSNQITEEKAMKMGIKGFLMKPLLLQDLAKKVRKVLDTTS